MLFFIDWEMQYIHFSKDIFFSSSTNITVPILILPKLYVTDANHPFKLAPLFSNLKRHIFPDLITVKDILLKDLPEVLSHRIGNILELSFAVLVSCLKFEAWHGDEKVTCLALHDRDISDCKAVTEGNSCHSLNSVVCVFKRFCSNINSHNVVSPLK